MRVPLVVDQSRVRRIIQQSKTATKLFRHLQSYNHFTALDADDWQRFKRDFVEEYGGELVQSTGMTHSEFVRYFTNGTRETGKKSLKQMLGELSTNQTQKTVTLAPIFLT